MENEKFFQPKLTEEEIKAHEESERRRKILEKKEGDKARELLEKELEKVVEERKE
ncbi:MAG: hypothetical protein AAB772_01500 [Patescibacteria group bacterium]